jgi:hypothetical protein
VTGGRNGGFSASARRVGNLTLLLAALAVGTAAAREPFNEALRRYLRLSDHDLAALARGDVVSRSRSIDSRELMGFGAVRVKVTAGEYARRFQDIVSFKRNEMVLQIGVFGRHPALSDVAALTLDDSDLNALSKCRVGDCDLRLPARAIERLHGTTRGDAGFRDRATVFMRELLVSEARAYLAGGGAALGPYCDEKKPLDRFDAFRMLLRESPFRLEHHPELARYLLDYPRATLPGVEELLYWSREKFGLKPVISLTHLVIYRPPDRPGTVFTATRQLYASHYFDASLGLSALLAASDDPGDRYLLYSNRSRLDTFGGLFGGLARAIAQRRVRDSLAENVRETKERLEAPATSTGASK